MELLCALLLAAAGIPTTVLLCLFLWAICYDFIWSRIPPEFEHPLKLRVIHWILIMVLGAGRICESLGICRQLDVVRYVVDLKKTKLDPSLFTKDLLFDGIPVRVYQPKAPLAGRRKGMLLFHGGAGLIGTIDLYQDISNNIAKNADIVLVSVGYGLSPEHPYPSQYTQCLAATVHFLKNAEDYGVDPSQVILLGDSAGGNIAAFIAKKLTERPDLPKLRAQVLIYACLQGLDFNLPSYMQNAWMPILYRENAVKFGLQYLRKDPALRDDVLRGCHVPEDLRLKYRKWVNANNIPEKFKGRGYPPVTLAPHKPPLHEQVPELLQATYSAILSEDHIIKQLPETFIVSCEYDILRDDNLLFKKRLEDCGVKVRWFHSEQGFHGVMNLANPGLFYFPAGVEILDCIIDFVKSL
uniref:Uncharacterized protein n=1 Tax=Sphaerodactylus townsendi TaxID=933632 RepID=A0ACB8EE39_9SAUR